MSSGDRLSDGLVEYFFVGAKTAPSKAWWPGEPSEWWSAKAVPTPPKDVPSRYVLAKAPTETQAKGGEEFARRIYGIPIFADPEMPAEECLALIDSTYQLGMTALISPELDQRTFFWDEDKKPSFGSLAGITAKDPLKFLPKDTPNPEECRIAFLSEGGNGGTLLVYRWKDSEAHFETLLGLSF